MRRGFWPAAYAYLALALPPVFLDWTFEADFLMLPWLLGAMLLAARDSAMAWLMAGLCWGAAFFTKQTALFYLPVFVVLRRNERMAVAPSFLIGVDLVALAVAMPFIADHRAADFWGAVSGYGGTYVRAGWGSLWFNAGPASGFRLIKILAVPSLICYGALIGYGWRALRLRKIRPAVWTDNERLVGIWTLCSAVACSFSGLFFGYYFVAFLPLGAICVVPGLSGEFGRGLQASCPLGRGASNGPGLGRVVHFQSGGSNRSGLSHEAGHRSKIPRPGSQAGAINDPQGAATYLGF